MKRLRVLAAVGLVAGSLGYVVAGGLREAVVYYVTPSELLAGRVEAGRPVRVGGQVVAGSLERADTTGEVRFVLTDGRTRLPVQFRGRVEGLLVEGQGAVVEGRLEDGVLRAHTVVVKHSEEYRPPE